VTALLDQLRTAVRAGSDDDEARRPLPVSGMLAAAWTLGVGLAVLTTLTLVGWIAAPKGTLGAGLPGVFRAACQLWLAAHHAGFAIPGGRIGLLPIGLMIMPAALLYRAALWMARDADLRLRLPARLPKGTSKEKANARRRAQLLLVAQAGISLAAPYALLAGLIALIARNEVTRPFIGEALVSHLVLAFLAGSVATARTIGPWRVMLRLLPERARSVVVGTAVALAALLAAGFVVVLGSIAVNFGEIKQLSDGLSTGFVGGLLLLLVEVLYLFNAVVWGMSYIAGPGFAIGTGTLVAPTGVKLGSVPAMPILGALPQSGASPAWVMAVLALPFAAGAVAGIVVVRIAPTPNVEAAPLWGFGCGLASGVAAGLLAALSGGPLGGNRLSAVGPSPWEVALSVTLEVGVAAGISAGLGNWWLISRRARLGITAIPMIRVRRPEPKVGQRPLPGHWLDAADCDTQPIPVIRDDWTDEHASAAAESFAQVSAPGKRDPGPAPRRDIVDETDDRGGHVIYVDPYAWDRD
jgi:hypothetical protein